MKAHAKIQAVPNTLFHTGFIPSLCLLTGTVQLEETACEGECSHPPGGLRAAPPAGAKPSLGHRNGREAGDKHPQQQLKVRPWFPHWWLSPSYTFRCMGWRAWARLRSGIDLLKFGGEVNPPSPLSLFFSLMN